MHIFGLPAHALPAPFSLSKMPSFALDFRTQGSDTSPSIEFGAIDHSKYVGPLASAPLNSTDGHWSVDNVDFSFDNVRMNTSINVILGAYRSVDEAFPLSNPSVSDLTDTGAGQHIIIPASVAEAYYSRVHRALFDNQLGDGLSLWCVSFPIPPFNFLLGHSLGGIPFYTLNPKIRQNQPGKPTLTPNFAPTQARPLRRNPARPVSAHRQRHRHHLRIRPLHDRSPGQRFLLFKLLNRR